MIQQTIAKFSSLLNGMSLQGVNDHDFSDFLLYISKENGQLRNV